MRDYVILSDSCCDLDKKMRELYGIEFVYMYVHFKGSEQIADLDWQEYSQKEFYDELRAGVICKTAQVSIENYQQAFEDCINRGLDVLSISTSSGLSGSVNASFIARDFVLAKYPDAKIICIDSLISSLGLGRVLVDAARLQAKGKTIYEVARYVEDERLYYWQVGSVESLKYLKRAGRVTGMTAFMGNLLGIKPIIISNIKGENLSVEKVKGRKNSIRRCVEMTKENIIDASNQSVFVVHADCLEEAIDIKAMLLEQVKCADVYINDVGPILGASCGPGMFGIYFKGKKREV